MAAPADLAAVIEELYGLEPWEFTARRDAIAAGARKAGDKDLAGVVKALRRPSAAAHAVNLLARSRREELAQLVGLGEQLRQAQESLSADDLRALGRQRGQLVAQMARQAAGLARDHGSSVSEAARREIESTLEAALGDPAASEAVTSGRLMRALARTGLDRVDLEGALAGGDSTRGPAPRSARDSSRMDGAFARTSGHGGADTHTRTRSGRRPRRPGGRRGPGR